MSKLEYIILGLFGFFCWVFFFLSPKLGKTKHWILHWKLNWVWGFLLCRWLKSRLIDYNNHHRSHLEPKRCFYITVTHLFFQLTSFHYRPSSSQMGMDLLSMASCSFLPVVTSSYPRSQTVHHTYFVRSRVTFRGTIDSVTLRFSQNVKTSHYVSIDVIWVLKSFQRHSLFLQLIRKICFRRVF